MKRTTQKVMALLVSTVLLLGLAPVATPVRAFADGEQIENTEAVAITAGIGLFAGSEGKFNPEDLVTRAQMATIIVKMLRGNDFNADAFKGVDKFSDTAAFEGGWAEGYINACVQMGVVAGYGDGTFKPGNTVTTAEALTMIINALGVDPGKGAWPLPYMAKAEEMKLYGDLSSKPGTYNSITRDQLAVLVYEGICYSPSGVTGYKVPGVDIVFTDIADAMKANGGVSGITEVVGTDSLANKVYQLKTATGVITGNQATGEDATILKPSNGSNNEFYGVRTGLDMLGHYVTVYYREQYENDQKPGEVYAVVDKSTVVTVNETVDSAKEYKAAFGKNYNVAQNRVLFNDSYTLENGTAGTIANYTVGSAAPAGTYIIYDGEIVAYMEPITVYASYIVDISSTSGVHINRANGDGYISNDEDDDRVVEYDGMAVGDIVTYVIAQGQYLLSPVKVVSGVVSASSKTEIDGVTYDTLTVDGKNYVAFSGVQNTGNKLKRSTGDLPYGENCELYLAQDGRYIGFKTAGSSTSLENVRYILGVIEVLGMDNYGVYSITYKARGIDMNGNEVLIPVAQVKDANKNGVYDRGEQILGDTYIAKAPDPATAIAAGFYTVENSTDKSAKKAGIQILKAFSGSRSEGKMFATVPAAKDTSYNKSDALKTADDLYTYNKEGSIYIVLDGALDSAQPLDVKVMTSISGACVEPDYANYPMLVTRSAGSVKNEIDVMIFRTDIKPFVETSKGIYVTQDQLSGADRTADGYSYTVYDADSGDETVIMTEHPIAGPGFYKAVTGEEQFAALSPIGDIGEDKDFSYYVSRNQGFLGLTGSVLRAENVVVKEENGEPTYELKAFVNNTAADKAAVIDLRTERQMEASGVPEITNVSQLAAMRENSSELVVVMDLYVNDASTDKVKTIYIKEVYNTKTPGLRGIVYTAQSPNAAGGELTAITARRDTRDAGDAVLVAYDLCNEVGTGFYSYGVNAADGKRILLKLNVDEKPLARDAVGIFGT